MPSKIIYLTDRTAAEIDDTCGMKYWLNRKEGGKGIVPKVEPLPLLIGRQIHEDLATIAGMPDIRKEAIEEMIFDVLNGLRGEDFKETRLLELEYRRLGWAAAYALFIEPGVREIYETINVEGELILDRDPLWVATTPDRVLKHRKEGWVAVRDYKSTISASFKWMNSWAYMPQLHILMAAVQEELGLETPVKFAQIMGLQKGYTSAVDRRLMHPYVWGYYNKKENKWSHSYDDGKKAGWEQMPVWEYPDGIVDWVQKCGQEVAFSQFPHTSPIFLNKRLLDEWVARRTSRERLISVVGPDCVTDLAKRSEYFERRTKNCRPAFGDACPYLKVCWNAEAAANPLADPDYEVRQPHHDVELIMGEGV
jgi:hypothetical protein